MQCLLEMKAFDKATKVLQDEIKKYPKLTEVGAWRNGSMIGRYDDQKFDTIKYGGFYTQEEIKEVSNTELNEALETITLYNLNYKKLTFLTQNYYMLTKCLSLVT